MANLTSQHPGHQDSGSSAVDTFTPEGSGRPGQRVFPGERRGHRRHGRGPPPDEGHRPGIAQQIGVPIGRAAWRPTWPSAAPTTGHQQAPGHLDMGAGSTDASIINAEGQIHSIHLAGAGNMVTLLIQSEMGLPDFDTAEDVKKYPGQVESLFHIRHENGTVSSSSSRWIPTCLPRWSFSRRTAAPLEGDWSMEKIRLIRQQAKQKVFVTSAIRALTRVSHRQCPGYSVQLVLVGGSALDFEVPQMVTDALSQYKVVAGRGNIRGTEGPCNAVATGLVLS